MVLVGNGRSFLAAIITGEVAGAEIDSQIGTAERYTAPLPEDSRVSRRTQPFTIENGLLTANGKLRRDAIAARFAARRNVSKQMYCKAGRQIGIASADADFPVSRATETKA